MTKFPLLFELRLGASFLLLLLLLLLLSNLLRSKRKSTIKSKKLSHRAIQQPLT